jgi:hypothetical protein
MKIYVPGSSRSDPYLAAQAWVAGCGIGNAEIVSVDATTAVVERVSAELESFGVLGLPATKNSWFADSRLRVVAVQPQLHAGVTVVVPFLVVARRTRRRCPFPAPTQKDRTAVLIRHPGDHPGVTAALADRGVTIVRSDDVPNWGGEKFRLFELVGHASQLNLPSILGPCLGKRGKFRVLGSYPEFQQ